jgi:hypothetical protein
LQWIYSAPPSIKPPPTACPNPLSPSRAAAAPDGLLATIGKLPGVRGADDDDVDTDGDVCSEATDMDDSE